MSEVEKRHLEMISDLQADRLVLLNSLNWLILASSYPSPRTEDLLRISDAAQHAKRIQKKL